MKIDVNDYLASIGVFPDDVRHYGTPRHSGRYPWGSGGEEGSQRNKTFLGYVNDLKKEGLSEQEIARGMGMTTTQLRTAKSIAKNQEKAAKIAMVERLAAKNYSNVAIAERMGLPGESSVRALRAEGQKDKVNVLEQTANALRERVDSGAYIDVGTGTEYMMGVSRQKLNTAVDLLRQEGYEYHKVQEDQIGTGNKTTFKVLAKPGTTYKDIVTNKENIQLPKQFSEDGGRSFNSIKPPKSISSKRVQVVYDEDGGSLADGVIYVRPGVPDVSIGSSRYAQVRIAVDDTHYLKGMAIYKDDLPPGVDLQFNTNKKRSEVGNDKLKAMKAIKDDPENPFGAIVRQRIDPKTGEPTSVMNMVGYKEGSGVEGSWETWSKNLPSQFLSKQSPKLAQEQLDVTYARRRDDLEAINRLTNPAVKKKLLDTYADSADSAAVHLKAAAMPRQSTHVILPVNSLKDTEIYAPNFNNGDRVVLVRFPHGGTFEIPELTVNNNHKEAVKLLGKQARDAVGINARVAERLSGADFDGDTVLVIPNNSGRIKSTPALERLKHFDAKREYAPYDGMRTMDGGTWSAAEGKIKYPSGKKPNSLTMGFEMGDVSNLITDMTIGGANHDELARAVKHSMVVIDAQKHGLNYRQSAIDNNIKDLKTKYQGGPQAGAATLISRATSQKNVRARKPRPAVIEDPVTGAKIKAGPIDPATGKKMWVETGEHWVDKKGKTHYKEIKSTKLAETDDAHTLKSDNDTRIENVYANHSNRMKALANEARKASYQTKPTPYSPAAKKAFASEVTSLNGKLAQVIKNRPLERQAQVLANAKVRAIRQDNPGMEPDQLKKAKFQALEAARIRVGAQSNRIHITDDEWAAIQAGAITNHTLTEILKKADLERVKELATPKQDLLMNSTKARRAETMAKLGYTQAEIASALGVSVTTLKRSLNG